MKSYISTALLLSPLLCHAQRVETVDPDTKTSAHQEQVATNEKEQKNKQPPTRNPFAANGGVTAQSSRLVREALNVTKILGIIHTSDGNKMAVLKIETLPTPLFVRAGSIFSIKVRGREWRDVEVIEIDQFEVKVTPKGTDGKIILR